MFGFLKRLFGLSGVGGEALGGTRPQQNRRDAGSKRQRAASFDLGNCSMEVWQSEIGGFVGAAGVSALACCSKGWRGERGVLF